MTNSERIYTFCCMLFAILVVLGNLTYQKFVTLDLKFIVFEISVGVLVYPLAFLISDLLAEFYGKQKATFGVRAALIMNATSGLIINIMDSLPATSWSKISDEFFHKMFGFYGVAFAGSIIAAYVAQTIDIRLYLFIKKLTGEKLLWLRSNVSTGISLLIDTVIVIGFMGFFGAIPKEHVLPIIFNNYSFKIIFILLNVPTFYLCAFIIRSLIKKSSH